MTGPPPEYSSLDNAESQEMPPNVSGRLITRGVARKVDASVKFAGYTEFWLALMPKAGGSKPEAVAAKGPLPDVLTK